MATAETTEQRLLIGGTWTEASSGNTYQQKFPFTGEPVGVAAGGDRAYGGARGQPAQHTPGRIPLARRAGRRPRGGRPRGRPSRGRCRGGRVRRLKPEH